MKLFSILSMLFIGCIGAGCFLGNNVTTIDVENQSTRTIDSVVFSIDGHICLMGAVPPNSTSSIKVSRDSIPSNKHDVFIIPAVYLRDTLIKDGGHYDDLSGSFQPSYRFVLNPDLTFRQVFK